jgi:protein phosphatase
MGDRMDDHDHLGVIARTDRGLVRSNNEDALVLARLPDGLVFGVCDGMGGAAAGEVASHLAAKVVKSRVGDILAASSSQGVARSLSKAVEDAGRAILDYASKHPECQGMGTTCTVAVVRGAQMTIAHVGDSRAYLFREGALEQLTVDHNLANALLARGEIVTDQLEQVFQGKCITQAVGTSDGIKVDVIHRQLSVGDRVLVCSDGLSDMVDAAGMANVLAGFAGDLEAGADELLRRAKAAGGRDNISLVMHEVVGVADVDLGDYRLPEVRRGWWASLAVVLLVGASAWWAIEGSRGSRLKVASPDLPANAAAATNLVTTVGVAQDPAPEGVADLEEAEPVIVGADALQVGRHDVDDPALPAVQASSSLPNRKKVSSKERPGLREDEPVEEPEQPDRRMMNPFR